MKNNKHIGVLYGFIALKILLQVLAINGVYELHRDEFLHVDLGYHLSWGYTSVPPVTGVLSYFIILLGKTSFWVKFFPALFGVLTLVVLWKMIEALGGGLYALVLGATCVLFSALLRINTLYQPNSLEYLIWISVFYFMIRFIQTESNKHLYMTAVLLAVGLLNKYNIGFLIIGLIPALAFSKHRTVFGNRHFYFALIVTFVIVAPNLYWQYLHNWPVVRHLGTLASTQLVNVDRSGFFIDQFLFFLGGIPVIIAGFIGFFKHDNFKKFKVFFWAFVIALILYAYLRAKSYYTIGFYPVFIAFGSVYLEHLLKGKWLGRLRYIFILLPLIIISLIFDVIVPIQSPEEIRMNKGKFQMLDLLRWEDGQEYDLPQDYADMLGWKELAEIVDTAIDQIEDPKHLIVQCDNYGQAGAINFYSRHKDVKAYTMSADYIYWYPLNDKVINHVVLVVERSDDDPGRTREKEFFQEVKRVGSIENANAREVGTTVYLLKSANSSVNAILEDQINDRLNSE